MHMRPSSTMRGEWRSDIFVLFSEDCEMLTYADVGEAEEAIVDAVVAKFGTDVADCDSRHGQMCL